MRPVDGVTLEQAALILGVARSTVQEWIVGGRLPSQVGAGEHRMLSQADVEELASEVYPWWLHVSEPDSWWVTGSAAAAVLGISRGRLDQLAAADRIPYVRHQTGRGCIGGPSWRC